MTESTLKRFEIPEPMYDRALASSGRRPMSKLEKLAPLMPLQDAIDLAAFLAHVQVQMNRFLPEEKPCGGAIDVMVLQAMPTPTVISLPGKTLRHPYVRT